MAGTLLEVGRGKQEPQWVKEILASKEKSYTRTKTSSKRLDINSDRISGGPRECRIALSYFRNC